MVPAWSSCVMAKCSISPQPCRPPPVCSIRRIPRRSRVQQRACRWATSPLDRGESARCGGACVATSRSLRPARHQALRRYLCGEPDRTRERGTGGRRSGEGTGSPRSHRVDDRHDLSKIKPGSDATMKLKAEPERRGAWSQYMEAVIGPDAEVFSKAQPMSAVGFGAPTWACWLRQTGAIRSRRSCCL
jgi:hypothetical protein